MNGALLSPGLTGWCSPSCCCICTGAVIGDSMAQWFTGGAFDFMRNIRMSVYGLVVGGPSGHYWHQVPVSAQMQ